MPASTGHQGRPGAASACQYWAPGTARGRYPRATPCFAAPPPRSPSLPPLAHRAAATAQRGHQRTVLSASRGTSMAGRRTRTPSVLACVFSTPGKTPGCISNPAHPKCTGVPCTLATSRAATITIMSRAAGQPAAKWHRGWTRALGKAAAPNLPHHRGRSARRPGIPRSQRHRHARAQRTYYPTFRMVLYSGSFRDLAAARSCLPVLGTPDGQAPQVPASTGHP